MKKRLNASLLVAMRSLWLKNDIIWVPMILAMTMGDTALERRLTEYVWRAGVEDRSFTLAINHLF